MSYLRELQDGLRVGRQDVGHLFHLLTLLVLQLDEWKGRAVSALKNLDDRLAPIEARLPLIEARLMLVDTLPAEAPYGALIRLRTGTVAERMPLYLGNGPGQPLTKLTPTVV